MGKSKKTAAPQTNSDQAEARPVGEGKDPLAEGNTLVNPSNTEAETHYDVKERSEDVQTSQIAGQDANERAEEHNAQAAVPAAEVPNSTEAEQDEAAEGRVEPGEEPAAEEAAEESAPEQPTDADLKV